MLKNKIRFKDSFLRRIGKYDKKDNKITLGFDEWGKSKVNFCNGCANDCRYCFAKKQAIRFGRKTAETWKVMELNEKALKKKYKKREGRVLFPTSHDITEAVLFPAISILEKLLAAGNEVLLTTKPRLSVIKEICSRFTLYQDKLEFRFTITTCYEPARMFWEWNAPSYSERYAALECAYFANYTCSASIEPFLDYDPVPLIKAIEKYCDTIWIGPMNYIQKNGLSEIEEQYYNDIRRNYTKENLLKIYNELGREVPPKEAKK